MELRRIDVLLNTDTQERFNEGELVKINTKGYGKEYVGKIRWIETLYITIDMSEKYDSNAKKIEYKDILKIEKCY